MADYDTRQNERAINYSTSSSMVTQIMEQLILTERKSSSFTKVVTFEKVLKNNYNFSGTIKKKSVLLLK